MFLRILLGGGALVAILVALCLPGSPPRAPYVQGRNKTALFITNINSGLSNVHVATAFSLLEKYPDIDVHYASFSRLRDKLARVSSFARITTPASKNITFHELGGPSFEKVLYKDLDTLISPPASRGINKLVQNLEYWMSPWNVEYHMGIYKQLNSIIDEVDPAVVVLDIFMGPGLDVTRNKNRLHALISPSTLVDLFLGRQPLGSLFWKYPAMSSGFKFPVPYANILENIYLNLRYIFAFLHMPEISAKRAALKARGIKEPLHQPYAELRSDVPWITMHTEGVSIPVDVVPPNVTCAGPILLSVAPASQQDPELANWLAQRPTVLINLGSGFKYNETHAHAMAGAVVDVLSKSDIQILWKFKKRGEYSDDALASLQPFIESGRLRMSNWLTVDPLALLDTGDIKALLHHGGSNCFHEAVAAGVPHIILPLWADLYNFAALSESLGIGIWGCRDTSPGWTAGGISSAILQAVDGGEASVSLRENSRKLGDKIKAGEKGREIAAREIAKLAYLK